ncbi:unnamed protein product [marine sediment metagenome]|uniref:Uncharacterized protein n=1 Tax=marine sediment metagenome TaxID=412755 RepID=X1A4Y4_9ZZZZ
MENNFKIALEFGLEEMVSLNQKGGDTGDGVTKCLISTIESDANYPRSGVNPHYRGKFSNK